MINNENLIKLYELVLNNNQLTTKQLINCGFNSNDLKKLVDENKLKRIKRGIYEFIDVEKLYFYGQNLIYAKQFDKANLCFKKCLEIDPKYIKSSFYLFLTNVRNENYEEAFKYFEMFYNDDTANKDNNNLYLYLFSFIIDLPDKYKNWAKKMLNEDVTIKGNQPLVSKINKIRELILAHKFKIALTHLSNLTKIQSHVFVSDLIIKKLLLKVIELGQITKKNILILLETKDYQYIIDMLEEKSNLSTMEAYILKLCRTYIEIDKNKTIYLKNNENTKDIFVAIDRNNFELALQLNKEKDVSTNPSIKILDIILNDIINRITKEKMFTSLECQDLDEAFKLLNQYLTKINKLKYETNIINIIKLCVVKNDISFIKLREVLEQLEKNDSLDIEYYVEKIYDLLNKKDFEQAQFYIDIINNLDVDIELIERLKKELNQSKTKLQKNKLPKPKKISNNKEIKQDENIKNNPYYQFLSKVSKEIENEKLILIYDMDKIQNIEQFMKYFPNMRSFTIEHNGGIVIVLKHRQNGRKDFRELIKEGKNAFEEKNYQKTIECFELIKSLSNNNTAFGYASLAWAYLKIGKLNRSLRYFIVANYLNKIESKDKDLSSIIEFLSTYLKKDEEQKPYFEMDIEELRNEFDDDYDIEPLQEIVNLININSMSIDEACLKFNLNEIQINIVKLIIARDCYIQQDYVTGDKLLKSVERSNHKNKKVIDLLNEIRINRLFYKNREEKQTLISNPKVLKY